jgi:hypothetical protein
MHACVGLFSDVAMCRTRRTAIARVCVGVGLPLNVLAWPVPAAAFVISMGHVMLTAVAAPGLTVGIAAAGVLRYQRAYWPWRESADALP